MKKYTIIDIETTGGRANRDRITEVAIVHFDGQQITDSWSSLINPECYIPLGITELTGITQEMVQDAPKFYEVAKEIVERTEGAVFVAHNARFDYSFIREEFRRLGFTFTRKQLCTVRLSRQAFPGLPSYSLGRLCDSLNISNAARHRAMGDAMATTEVLQRILQQEEHQESAEDLINLGIKEALLPQNLNLDKLHALPESCGVYYFYNQKEEVVYVGKSINIKKRVAEHFADKTEKARKLQQHVHDLSFELTGSELVALLLESHEIKRLRPMVNRAQRVRKFPFVIHSWPNEDGYICFGAEQVKAAQRKKLNVLSEYPKIGHAKNALSRVREAFGLCDHYCQSGNHRKGACFYYHLKQCTGACIQEESAEAYNERATLAAEHLCTVFERDFIILDEGRESDELAVIQVQDGNYRGFGYVSKDFSLSALEQLTDIIQPYPGNPETRRIIQRYLSKKGKYKVISF